MIAAVVLGLLVSLAGCGNPGAFAAPAWEATRMLPRADPLWTTAGDGGTEGTPLIAQRALISHSYHDYADDHRGYPVDVITAHDLSTGKTLWTSHGPNIQATVRGDQVVLRDRGRFTVRRAHDGHIVARFTASGATSYAVVGDSLIYLTGSGRLVAVSLAEGKRLWDTAVPRRYRDRANLVVPRQADALEPAQTLPATQFAVNRAVDSPVVLVSRSYGVDGATAFNSTTGNRQWTSPVDSRGSDTTPLQPPLVTGRGTLYASFPATRCTRTSYLLDTRDGRAREFTDHAYRGHSGCRFDATPRIDGDELFTVDSKQRLTVIDTSTGDTRWRADAPRPPVYFGHGIVGDQLTYHPPGDDKKRRDGVRATDTRDGDTLWVKRTIATEGILNYAAISDTDLLTAAFAKVTPDDVTDIARPLQVIDLKSGEGRWQIDGARLVDFNASYYVFSVADRNGDDEHVAVVSRRHPRLGLELVVEADPVGAVVIDGEPPGPGDSGELAGAGTGNDGEVLPRPVGAGGGGRVREVEGATPTVQGPLEGLHGHVGADAAGLVEGGGEDGGRAPGGVAVEVLGHDRHAHGQRGGDGRLQAHVRRFEGLHGERRFGFHAHDNSGAARRPTIVAGVSLTAWGRRSETGWCSAGRGGDRARPRCRTWRAAAPRNPPGVRRGPRATATAGSAGRTPGPRPGRRRRGRGRC